MNVWHTKTSRVRSQSWRRIVILSLSDGISPRAQDFDGLVNKMQKTISQQKMNRVFEILYAIPKEYKSNINRKNKKYQEE